MGVIIDGFLTLRNFRMIDQRSVDGLPLINVRLNDITKLFDVRIKSVQN